jgi:hypothetical protein
MGQFRSRGLSGIAVLLGLSAGPSALRASA